MKAMPAPGDPPAPAALSAELRERARAVGFDAVGIARAGRLERDGAALGAWLERGAHAGMAWMEHDPGRRADPRRLLPDCRSVVALAMNYRPAADEVAPPAGRSRVATYARGRDYHKILGRAARDLAAWLAEASGMPARAHVDTAPLLERAWAERAGLGWIGKNACLLTRELGSWLLLAELLSATELEPDDGPHPDHCGSCNACVEACPTSAIVADGVVDSNACISYWTIKHRGAVPEERRAGNGDWIFGCDVCQDVCPWNLRFARPVDPGKFERREDLRGLDPIAVLGMDEPTFRRTYSGTALMRAKWEGMRRNACIVLGNRRDPAALPALRTAARDGDSVLREHANWAIRSIETLPDEVP